MSYMTIRLDGDDLTDDQAAIDDPKRAGWWSDGSTLTVRTAHTEAVYRLPKGRPKVVISRLGGGQATLHIGGFTTTTVVVSGPRSIIESLRKEVL